MARHHPILKIRLKVSGLKGNVRTHLLLADRSAFEDLRVSSSLGDENIAAVDRHSIAAVVMVKVAGGTVGILEGKKLLVTGVLTDDSLAYGVAKNAQLEGATIILTGFGRGLSLTQRTARKLPETPEVLELDVANPDHLAQVVTQVTEQFGTLDGLLHAIGFAPGACLGNGMMAASWPDVATMLEISTYSYKALAEAFTPILADGAGGSIVGLDFDASLAWPGYDWMGVAKAALESLNRYLARDLGTQNIRVNLVAAGPIRTIAAKSIPGFNRFEEVWSERAPLGWDVTTDADAVARACIALLSDWFPRTTGEIIHVDGGFHAVGA